MHVQVPLLPRDRDLAKTLELQNDCVSRRTLYYNRAMKSAVCSLIKPLHIASKSAMVAAFQFITGQFNASAAVHFPSDKTLQDQRPIIAAELAMLSNDPDIILDLRSLNGRVSDPAFDAFWQKVDSLLEEYKRVDDRRHGEQYINTLMLLTLAILNWCRHCL